jgi:hypothetical protein
MEADTAGACGDVCLSVTGDVDTAVIEVVVRARWSRRVAMDVYVVLRDCLAEHPSAIIIDLHGLIDLDAASAVMWLAASRAAGALRPPAQVVLCLPPTRQLAGHLRQRGAVRFLPMHATMTLARAAVAGRLTVTDRLHLNRLPPEPGAATVAGDAVAVACAAWRMPDLLDPGRQIVTEMVAHSVAQARTDMALTISMRGTGLHLAVSDGDRRLPCAPAPPGSGLSTVESRASAWGAMPTRDGKVVWAIVRPR